MSVSQNINCNNYTNPQDYFKVPTRNPDGQEQKVLSTGSSSPIQGYTNHMTSGGLMTRLQQATGTADKAPVEYSGQLAGSRLAH
jgi:hypothetical protein